MNPVCGWPQAPQRVEIRFTALSLVAPDRNRFKYKLSNLNPDWVEAGPQRVAAYPHLPPDRYVFRVIAANNDGVWNNEGASLAFTVCSITGKHGGSASSSCSAC